MESNPAGKSTMHAAETKAPLPDLMKWTVWGAVLQIAMVVAGHYNEFVKTNVFAIGGMMISLVFGALYARSAARSKGGALLGGLVVGGACALLGIAVSFLLGDVPAAVLAFGTAGSAAAGLVGGIVLYAIASRKSR